MSIRRVYMNNAEITRYVTSISDVEERAPLFGEILMSPIVGMTLDNHNEEFNWLSTVDVSDAYARIPVWIDVDDQRVFDGFVLGYTIQRFTNVVDIQMADRLTDVLNRKVSYQSAYATNPALVVEELFQLFKVPADWPSLAAGFTYYEAGSDPYRIFVSSINTRTLGELLADICQVGLCAVYFAGGVYRFAAYRDPTTNPVLPVGTLRNRDFYDDFTVTQPEKEIPSGFVVDYVGGSYLEGQIDNAGSIVANGTAEVQVTNLPTATLLAARWLEYLRTPFTQFQTYIKRDLALAIPLGTVVSVEDFPQNFMITAMTRTDLEVVLTEAVSV